MIAFRPLLQLPPASPGAASDASCASDFRSCTRPRSGIARRTTIPSAARQYAPFLPSRTSSKSPHPYGLAKSKSDRLIFGASLSVSCARTGNEKARCRVVSATGLPLGNGPIRLRIASRDECPAAHVFPVDVPRPGAACEGRRQRGEGARSAARRRRVQANARSPARQLRRSDRKVVRHAFLLSSCRAALDARARAITTLRVAGCREGKGFDLPTVPPTPWRNVFRSGSCYVVASAPNDFGSEFGKPRIPRAAHDVIPQAATPWAEIISVCMLRVMVCVSGFRVRSIGTSPAAHECMSERSYNERCHLTVDARCATRNFRRGARERLHKCNIHFRPDGLCRPMSPQGRRAVGPRRSDRHCVTISG